MQAEQICKQVIADSTNAPEAWNLLGGIALRQGRPDIAAGHFSAAIESDPHQSEYQQGMGIACFSLGQFPEAVRCFEQAIALDRRNPGAHANLGNCLLHGGDIAGALRCYRHAIAADAGYLQAYLSLADVLVKRRDHKQAVKVYSKGLRHASDRPGGQSATVLLHHRLGLSLRELGRTDDAIAQYRRAIEIQPDFALAHNSLGGARLARNELEEASSCFREALRLEPGWSRVHSNILMTMNYQAGLTQAEIYAESLNFDAGHCRALLDARSPSNNRNKKRVLRIGYVSPDFRDHSVAHFIRKLIPRHNRKAFSIVCYSDVEIPDTVTAHFQSSADLWRPTVTMTDEQLADQVRCDGIDILVDLAGHTSNNRLLVFARRPAPVQVSWLGYPNTTGMQAMDYRLTDAIADPPEEAGRWHTEELVRLPGGFLCFQGDDVAATVEPPPCLKQGRVTFGSFNMIRKITPEVMQTWSRIMHAVPGSRLMIKSHALQDRGTRSRFLAGMRAHGVRRRRLTLLNSVASRHDHLRQYSAVDIGLDPFPYNGTTTTLEALWMGVPVISLHGDRHAGRVGASILHRLGLEELVGDTTDDYVDIATRLASDVQRLRSLREELRDRLRQSTLMDVRKFTAVLESSYRKMWEAWCDGKRR